MDASGGAGRGTLVVTARKEGLAGDGITVAVSSSSIVASANVVQTVPAPGLTASNNTGTMGTAADAGLFRAGDSVLLTQPGGGGLSETATVASTDTTAGTITFRSNLTNSYAAGSTIRIANIATTQRMIRLASTTGISPGSYVRLSRAALEDFAVVVGVEGTNNFITLDRDLTNTYPMDAGPAPTIQTLEFNLAIVTPGSGTENFNNLSMDPRHPRYFASQVDSPHVKVELIEPPNPSPAPQNRPRNLAATSLAGGANDNIPALTATNYTDAINSLERVDEVTLLSIPDRTDQQVQAAMIAHCEKMQDRFAILDPIRNSTPTQIEGQRNALASVSGYAAIYYPWIVIGDPVAPGRIKVPPSGHVAGVMARTDSTRGVHKAPANEQILGALGLERTLTDGEQGPLNEKSVNVIRSFPGRGVVVWGARTISLSTQWRYVNVRRLLLFIEESIQEGTMFAVFEPNDLALWAKLKRQVTDFLTRVWRDGALFGATPDDAFRVRVDEELNPPGIRALGQVVIEVVLFPVTPAEFIVFRIIQQPGGPVVQE
ncbi:MAG: phage tail sheath subtilisin-like domain-containing protein, partial [Acidobacteria bacterium]|nr:phage tail sheath subtilisin-like domain-containing protein [Acidobacteriota bacterium]